MEDSRIEDSGQYRYKSEYINLKEVAYKPCAVCDDMIVMRVDEDITVHPWCRRFTPSDLKKINAAT